MPKHIAFIMDGNRRWAKERGWSPMTGHGAMRKTLQSLLIRCSKLNIKAVSVYAFSTENWRRPTEEVDFLMKMYEDLLRIDAEVLLSLGCRISVMGEKTKLPDSLQKACTDIEEKSSLNSGTHVNYAINYSGKHDIIQACKNIAAKVKDGILVPTQISEDLFKHELGTKMIEFPYPDLVVRTSGEIRLSNFMLWQMAYSELYFTAKMFPDFEEDDLMKALLAFQDKCECNM
uniref:(2Z,6Z)-farnesyl diphosphate synthase CPT6, chloroplastic-like n=1 Tax=Erigeron canadensis TaxID=72917 RepID=UPI001CB8ED8B|nr:(2Z,6Z)-farnesyl diphosphate synthase CPT6, chloroplastic-like [Erigeron canadensis]